MSSGSLAPRADFTITFADGNVRTGTTIPFDYHYVVKHLGADGEVVGSMYGLAFSVMRRAGFAGDDFEAWLMDVADIVVALDEPDPKAKGQPKK